MQRAVYLVLLGAIVLLSVVSAQASQIAVSPDTQPGAVNDSYVDRVAYLEQKVANLETDLANCQDCAPVCDDCCRTCSTSPGIIGGYDFLWLTPHFAQSVAYIGVYGDWWNPNVEDAGEPAEATAPDSAYFHPVQGDYEFTPKLWLGYQGCCGLGARITYWQYDQKIMAGSLEPGTGPDYVGIYYIGNFGQNYINAAADATLDYVHALEMHVLDFDITQELNWGRTDITVGGGLRYARVRFDSTAATILIADESVYWDAAVENTFEGIGPTAFLDVERQIGETRLSVVGGVRGSVLFGRQRWEEIWDYHGHTAPPPAQGDYVLDRGDRTVGTIGGSIGLQYNRSFREGVDAFVRCSWQGEMWFDVGSPTRASDDMAMEGLSVAVGITR